RSLAAGYYDGEDPHFTQAQEFDAANGFLGIGRRQASDYREVPSSAVWATVKNQFFVSIATPKEPAKAFHIQPVNLEATSPTADKATLKGIKANLEFEIGTVPANDEKRIDVSYYGGPKE